MIRLAQRTSYSYRRIPWILKVKSSLLLAPHRGLVKRLPASLRREGARVVLAARRVDRLESLAQEINGMGTGAETLVVQADLSRLEDIQSLITQTLNKFGRIDVLVNNAGFGRLDWLENLDPKKDIQAQFDVNVLGVVQTTRQALPVMIKQRSGHIINMCSMAGLVATPTYTIYAACKHAVHGFSEALRREVKALGDRCFDDLSWRSDDRIRSARRHQAQDTGNHSQIPFAQRG